MREGHLRAAVSHCFLGVIIESTESEGGRYVSSARHHVLQAWQGPGNGRQIRGAFLISQKLGMGATRVLTDISAERYWTVVSEMEVPSLDALSDRASKAMADPEFQAAMQGYHDLVDHGRQEIYTIEK